MSSVRDRVGGDGGDTTETAGGATIGGIDATKGKYLVSRKNQINK